MRITRTSYGCIGQCDRLKPHREEVHDREVAYGDEKVRYSDQCRYFLFEKGRGENWLRSYEEFNKEKEDGEFAC